MADGKISVTLKEGTGFDSPWIVASGDTVAEVKDALNAIEQSSLIADVGRVASQFKGVAALGGTLGARGVDAPNAQQPSGAPQGAQQQPQAGTWAAGPQQGAQQPQQGAPAGGPRIVKDNFNNEWEYDVAGAPMTPRGPAIVKRGNGPKGPWRKWYDPAQGPEWFAQRMPKVQPSDRWQGEFIN
jgi:hypothetical protein